MSQKEIFVTQFGCIWRLNRRNAALLARQMEAGEAFNLDVLGTLVARDPILVTDSTPEVIEKLRVAAAKPTT